MSSKDETENSTELKSQENYQQTSIIRADHWYLRSKKKHSIFLALHRIVVVADTVFEFEKKIVPTSRISIGERRKINKKTFLMLRLFIHTLAVLCPLASHNTCEAYIRTHEPALSASWRYTYAWACVRVCVICVVCDVISARIVQQMKATTHTNIVRFFTTTCSRCGTSSFTTDACINMQSVIDIRVVRNILLEQ